MCNWLLVEMTSWLKCVKMNNTLRSTSYFYIIMSTDIYTMIVLVTGPVDHLFWRDYYIIILQCSFQMLSDAMHCYKSYQQLTIVCLFVPLLEMKLPWSVVNYLHMLHDYCFNLHVIVRPCVCYYTNGNKFDSFKRRGIKLLSTVINDFMTSSICWVVLIG